MNEDWGGNASLAWVVENSPLKGNLYRALFCLAAHAKPAGTVQTQSWAHLGRILCVTDRTAKKYIKELTDGGHLIETAHLTWRINTTK